MDQMTQPNAGFEMGLARESMNVRGINKKKFD